METRAHHVLIGTFTLAVVLAGLLFVLWLGKNSVDRAYAYYDVVFNVSVTGLSRGGMVQYNGIKVGQVDNLKLDPNDPRKVIARIQVASGTPVKQDTHAKLGLLGLTGIAFIQLYGGTPSSPPLRAHGKGLVAVILANKSGLSNLLNSSQSVATRANEALQSIQELLSKQNIQHISALFKHLDQTSAALAEKRGSMQQAISQLAIASQRLNQALLKIDHLAATTDRLVNKQGRATLLSAQASMQSLQALTAQLQQLVAQNSGALTASSRGLAQLGPTLRAMQKTLHQLNTLIIRARNNPAAYLLGHDAPKEYRPQ